MVKPIGLFFAFVAAAFTVKATLALAAQPHNGAMHFGGAGEEESSGMQFDVSANGSVLTPFPRAVRDCVQQRRGRRPGLPDGVA
jgi:hypothetical protein